VTMAFAFRKLMKRSMRLRRERAPKRAVARLAATAGC
jgi:hypothetical protein